MKIIYRLSLWFATAIALVAAPGANELRLAIRSDPRSFNPLLVDEESGDIVRYLTAGVLMRIDRVTQRPEPELALAWNWKGAGKTLQLELRKGVRFSDGSPFSSEDVVYTFQSMLKPELHSPLADAFRSSKGAHAVRPLGEHSVQITFPEPIAGIERLLDQVPILSRKTGRPEDAVLGPFVVDQYAAGSHLVLRRNPNYWKKDRNGARLPYLDRVRLDIQANRDIEVLRFRRGELDMIRGLDAEAYEQLQAEHRIPVMSLGAGFDSEMLWFNQTGAAPIPAYRKQWFRSTAFRKAVSHAINRTDLVRLVYHGHAEAAGGPYTSGNRIFYNPAVTPDEWSPERSRRLLAADGFAWRNEVLYDRAGNRVEFSLITNSGNKNRARIASLLQQDLRNLGIRVSVVPLDFPSLVERITKTFAYEACLLGLVNVDPDPNGQMNVWLSSGANHQWNPRQTAPETAWEAEIDKLMRAQASTLDIRKRQQSFFRVQEIISEQTPFIYLVSPHSLAAATAALRSLAPSAMRPHLLWNIEHIRFEGAAGN
jgi:peptide/nickel transport system substrate-binding protein